MLSSLCNRSETLQVPSHFALTPPNSGACVARCRAGDGAVDVPDVWLQVIRGPCSKSERWSRMSVTRQQQSTLGHRRTVHVGFPCSASRPATNQNNCRCSCPSHLDTRNRHHWWRLEMIATVSSCGAGLAPMATSLRRTMWRLSRPSRVGRDHL